MSQDLLFVQEISWNGYLLLGFLLQFFQRTYVVFVLLFFRNGLQNYNLFFILQLFLKKFLTNLFTADKRTAKINIFISLVTFLFQNF